MVCYGVAALVGKQHGATAVKGPDAEIKWAGGEGEADAIAVAGSLSSWSDGGSTVIGAIMNEPALDPPAHCGRGRRSGSATAVPSISARLARRWSTSTLWRRTTLSFMMAMANTDFERANAPGRRNVGKSYLVMEARSLSGAGNAPRRLRSNPFWVCTVECTAQKHTSPTAGVTIELTDVADEHWLAAVSGGSCGRGLMDVDLGRFGRLTSTREGDVGLSSAANQEVVPLRPFSRERRAGWSPARRPRRGALPAPARSPRARNIFAHA